MEHYTFPVIEHIDQVLLAIQGRAAFNVLDKGDYKIVNYHLGGPEVFPECTGMLGRTNSILRECRGIAFDATGKIARRPFHKFFNYMERDETLTLNLANRHQVLEKLDGSMVAPIYLPKKENAFEYWRLGTKSGVTDVSMQAEQFMASNPEYIKFVNVCREYEITPIFEWCSRQNRIIIDHPEDRLVLTAMREMKSGKYIDQKIWDGIETIKTINRVGIKSMHHFVEWAKKQEDEEGYILRFEDGHMIKVKSDWYCNLHKSKELMDNEKNIVKLVIDEKIDDILPLLTPEDKVRVQDFAARMRVNFQLVYESLCIEFNKLWMETKSRKEFAFALAKRPQSEQYRTSYMYKMFDFRHDNTEMLHYMTEKLSENCGSNRAFEKVRWLIGDIRFKPEEEKAAA
jgi:RNA ligase